MKSKELNLKKKRLENAIKKDLFNNLNMNLSKRDLNKFQIEFGENLTRLGLISRTKTDYTSISFNEKECAIKLMNHSSYSKNKSLKRISKEKEIELQEKAEKELNYKREERLSVQSNIRILDGIKNKNKYQYQRLTAIVDYKKHHEINIEKILIDNAIIYEFKNKIKLNAEVINLLRGAYLNTRNNKISPKDVKSLILNNKFFDDDFYMLIVVDKNHLNIEETKQLISLNTKI